MSHIEQTDRKNLVMVQDGVVIGTSGFGKSRMAEMNSFGEIISLYFLPEYMGKGYGGLLLQTERCLYRDIGGRELKEVQYCYQNA